MWSQTFLQVAIESGKSSGTEPPAPSETWTDFYDWVLKLAA